MSKQIRIGVFIGDRSYLGQCTDGLNFLQEKQLQAKLVVENVKVGSANSNLYDIVKVVEEFIHTIDVLIVASGLANHWPGIIDGYLHYDKRNDQLRVIGVAFSDADRDHYGQFASQGITLIPDSRLISSGLEEFPFIDKKGFLKACEYVAAGKFPPMKLIDSASILSLSLEEAIAECLASKG